MKWITPEKIKIEYGKTYFAKWPSGTVIKSTGKFQESDGTFFWNERDYIPVLKKEWPMLLILEESPSTEVKGQQGRRTGRCLPSGQDLTTKISRYATNFI